MYFNIKPLALLAVTALAPLADALRYDGHLLLSPVAAPASSATTTEECAAPSPLGLASPCSLPTFQRNGGGARATHMNWFNSPQGGRRNVIASRANNFTCGHSGFTYHDDSGVERSIKVPLGEAEVIVESYTEKDFAKLASYETY
ncbi:hypothetical protein BDN71DRAFT_1513920 [Pleurotus eryngii]|uniref:Uncharacterized protein n=1 Tax=Pleurotus eryngii TaxID=5323 RepID=A0A9P5ZG94_PLEER|nr:hypothetical protein BDN71DRAFT_1513920 [Pleurotus eryngii]